MKLGIIGIHELGVDLMKQRQKTDLYAVREQARSGSTNLGLRERHKLDKLERISNAAELLFGRDGYDGTTLRDIANEAGVALGTLSLYAKDKRDLIVLLFNKLLPPLLEQGRNKIKPGAPLVENMVGFFEPFYRAYANNATLYRIILGQIFSSFESMHAKKEQLIRAELIHTLSDLIFMAGAAGEISSEGDRDIQARSFFYLYFAAVRYWLVDAKPAPDQGLAILEALFEQHVRGFGRISKESR